MVVMVVVVVMRPRVKRDGGRDANVDFKIAVIVEFGETRNGDDSTFP